MSKMLFFCLRTCEQLISFNLSRCLSFFETGMSPLTCHEPASDSPILSGPISVSGPSEPPALSSGDCSSTRRWLVPPRREEGNLRTAAGVKSRHDVRFSILEIILSFFNCIQAVLEAN